VRATGIEEEEEEEDKSGKCPIFQIPIIKNQRAEFSTLFLEVIRRQIFPKHTY
jgi:hypothetical protein